MGKIELSLGYQINIDKKCYIFKIKDKYVKVYIAGSVIDILKVNSYHKGFIELKDRFRLYDKERTIREDSDWVDLKGILRNLGLSKKLLKGCKKVKLVDDTVIVKEYLFQRYMDKFEGEWRIRAININSGKRATIFVGAEDFCNMQTPVVVESMMSKGEEGYCLSFLKKYADAIKDILLRK